MDNRLSKNGGNDLFLSRTECNMLRGVAIILIVLNNFGHNVNGVHTDNEFNYNYDRILGFYESFANHSSVLPLELLSFYSPFGVMLFIFLSGYGLVLKYEKGNGRSISNFGFVFDHYKKLFVMQAKGLAFFLLLYLLFESKEIVHVLLIVKQLLLAGNVFSRHFVIIPGPYWFFGMIFEMYIIYRFLLYRCSSKIMLVIVLASLIIMGFLEPNGRIITYFRMNVGLALLPFSLGVLAARHWRKDLIDLDSKLKCMCCFIIAFVFLTLSKLSFYTWLFMPFFIVVTSVAFVKLLVNNMIITRSLVWFGGLSGVMFVIHPALREILITRANENGQCYEVLFIYFFLTIVLSVMLKPVFSK